MKKWEGSEQLKKGLGKEGKWDRELNTFKKGTKRRNDSKLGKREGNKRKL